MTSKLTSVSKQGRLENNRHWAASYGASSQSQQRLQTLIRKTFHTQARK